MAHRYEIEIRGRATERTIRPATDEFAIENTQAGNTRLTGEIRDPSHLHGLLAHFTSMNAEIVGLRRLDDGPTDADPSSTTESSPCTHQQKGIQP